MRTIYNVSDPADRRHVGAQLAGVVQGFERGEPYGAGLEAIDALILHLQQQAANAAMARARATWWERLRGRAIAEPSPADLARMEGYMAGLYDLRAAIVDAARAAATPQPEESAAQPRGYRPAAMGLSGVRA